MARSSLAPALRLALQQAVNPDDDLNQSVDDILAGLKLLEAKRAVCAEADLFYKGDVGMVYATAKVRQILATQGVEEIDDFNYAKIPVDVVANRLNILDVKPAPAEEGADNTTPGASGAVPGTGKQATGASVEAATKAIAQIRKDNQLDAEEKRLWKDVSKHGDAYVLVWPVREGKRVVGVDMRVHTADSVIMVYDPEDLLMPAYVLKSWSYEQDKKPVTRANLYYEDHTERWTTEPGGNPEKDDAWFKLTDAPDELDIEAASEGDEFEGSAGDIPNPYGRIPWFHYRNDRPEGIPEHRGAYGPQQMINKLVYTHAGTIDYQGFPQRYLLQDPLADDPMQNIDDPEHPDDDSDDPETDTGHSGLRSDAAALWKLWGRSAGEFSAADPDVFLRPFDRYVKAMAELTDTPQHAFTKATADMPSGEAVRQLNGSTNSKVGDRQAAYGAVAKDQYEFGLEILGYEGISIDIRWAPIEVVIDSAGWQVVQQKIAAGVPPEVALVEAGYPPEQVAEWVKDATGADLGRRVALLGQIATATQALGASIVTGAVSGPQVQALISGLFGDLLAGTDIELPVPKPDDFVDPQAALKAQSEAQDKQLEHQQGLQQAQLDHASKSQETSQEHARRMAVEAHQRARDMLDQGGGPQQGERNGRRPARAGG
jgi:hypothetical protein